MREGACGTGENFELFAVELSICKLLLSRRLISFNSSMEIKTSMGKVLWAVRRRRGILLESINELFASRKSVRLLTRTLTVSIIDESAKYSICRFLFPGLIKRLNAPRASILSK